MIRPPTFKRLRKNFRWASIPWFCWTIIRWNGTWSGGFCRRWVYPNCRKIPRSLHELWRRPGILNRSLSRKKIFSEPVFYQDNARRVSLQKQAGDVDAYLASLNMEITFQPFDPTGRARIAQLINKSNQFNLTTKRYTEAEVQQAEEDPTCFTLQVRLLDSFGDNGMISVIVCRQTAADVWEFDTWLMSCRVLGTARAEHGAAAGD